MHDLYAIQNRVKDITGYTSHLMRFPGGSSNTVSKSYSRGIMSRLVKRVANEGFSYFDWNVSSGDAGGASTSDAVYNNVVNSLKEGESIVLQHDTKKFSIDAVERIINYANENGYTFSTLTESSFGAHHGVNN
jgi:peptidoglycan/xylan/chitin deacetylase (PgdA/CDA1 family)